MKGKVNTRNEAILKLRVLGPHRKRRTISAVIDTGYSGILTLPPAIIRALGLQRVAQSDAKLADGRIVTFDVYVALLEWNRKILPIYVDEAAADPLVGMSLLAGHQLWVQVKRGGKVSITRL